VPPYGAARGYFDQADWKAGAMRLAEQAQAIVICLEDSEGVWWEVENLVNPHFGKALFLLHPRFVAPAGRQFLEKLIARVPALVPYQADLLAPPEPHDKIGVIGFFVNGDEVLMLGRSSTFSHFTYLLMLRWFLLTKSKLLP